MKVSYNTLLSYNVEDSHFFENRDKRNSYFVQNPQELTPGVLCAIGAVLADTDPNADVWTLEIYNGANWQLRDVDPNYSLVVTNEGLKAITYIKQGHYHFEIVDIKIRKNNIVNPSVPIIQWDAQRFESFGDIVLDTTSSTNTSFTIANNLSWRSNLANGGIQFSITLEPETYGELSGAPVNSFTVGSVGLYVADPTEPTRKILFAIGNLNTPIPKYSTTATKIGNSIRLLLNTVVSNLGYIANFESINESVNSIPEVTTDGQLITNYNGTESPYNIYLVDNLKGSNVPALAIRKGDPSKGAVTWEYITPRDDTITVEDAKLDLPALKDYMVTTWNDTTQKFEPATSRDGKKSKTAGNNLTGIKVGNTIIFAGVVANFSVDWKYRFTITNPGTGYRIGDTLKYQTENNTTFILNVTNIDNEGKILQYIVTPTSGDEQININDALFLYFDGEEHGGSGFRMDISSNNYSTESYNWNFPESWYNSPLYVAKTQAAAGTLTNVETDYFIGWCIGTGTNSKIKLALDLDDQASYTDYGTTRYATETETNDVTQWEAVSEVTAVVPKNLQRNYLQKTKISGNPGESAANPVVVESHVKFAETVVGKGVNDLDSTFNPNNPNTNVSFYGLAYRAWWGDLAEYYSSDKVYPAGTLITIGDGIAEITKAITECNGIISDKPGYELGTKKDEKDLPVALVGKVPVMFDGECMPKFGDRIYLSQKVPGRATNIPYGRCLGKIIDKDEHLEQKTTILCSVRISF